MGRQIYAQEFLKQASPVYFLECVPNRTFTKEDHYWDIDMGEYDPWFDEFQRFISYLKNNCEGKFFTNFNVYQLYDHQFFIWFELVSDLIKFKLTIDSPKFTFKDDIELWIAKKYGFLHFYF